jgi:ABC-type phosphonate transport system ATPase subunit
MATEQSSRGIQTMVDQWSFVAAQNQSFATYTTMSAMMNIGSILMTNGERPVGLIVEGANRPINFGDVTPSRPTREELAMKKALAQRMKEATHA